MSEYLLSTSGLTKQFGHHKAVNNVDLHVKKGAIYGFIGRNGAGKTTFLKMITGICQRITILRSSVDYSESMIQNILRIF